MPMAPPTHQTDTPHRAVTPLDRYSTDLPAPASQRSSPTTTAAAGRLVSLDAYRGLIMLLMISAGLQIGAVVSRFDSTPGWSHLDTPLWRHAAFQTDHTAWAGCSLWDLIQPSFMFMVGTALAFSVASRRASGQSFARMLLHALFRSAALVLLAVFLSSTSRPRTNWLFTNVLAQIGLGYPFLFLLAWVKPRWQFFAAMLILIACWGAFALYPAPPVNLDLASAKLPADWHRLSGFASHWEKNTNFAAHVDQRLLNLFPRPDGKRFTFEPGGYQTLNFVPSLATMIFGLLAGELLRARHAGAKKVGVLLLTGAVALAAGWGLGHFGICPVVKRIWTPSWALFSTGWALMALAAFYLVLDVWRIRRWEYPLIVVGANSIGIYCVSQMLKPFVRESMRRHFGQDVYELPGRCYAWLRYQIFAHTPPPADTFADYGKMFAPMTEASLFLIFCWVLCWWAYRKRLFIKI
ncbi:MAG TPA: DUF5009 domain-containing protein [Tepidisphaeraceae bacterium]|nr:DUF5009 domain-containing protein [Tepidisphaeraceae bacterium]